MSIDEIVAGQDAFPPGVVARQRTSFFYLAQVPDLIGVKDRKYLDRTGLQQQRSIGDLMRYAAMNRGRFDGGDALANHNGFIPAGAPRFQKRPDPTTQARYSDDQLYALGLYSYSLQPLPNPEQVRRFCGAWTEDFRAGELGHVPHAAALHQQQANAGRRFHRAGGPPEEERHLVHERRDRFELNSQDPRGTGYYKVPSLKGVWYRSMFGHSGWCATLEDWFDPHRVRDDYIPTGFKPYGAKTYAVKGHPFGLGLSAEDRKALIALLRTL